MFQFFIDRPIFSTVLSILILIGGGASLWQLPVEQYPEVVPPQIVVQATYPPGPAHRSSPIRFPRRSSRPSTALTTCCTWSRMPPTPAPCS